MRKKTRTVTLSAMLTALSVVFLYLSCIVPTGKLSLVAIAGILPAAAVIASGLPAGAMCYAATAILSILLLPDKGAAIIYILVFGPYPMVKSLIERINNLAVEWVIKIVYFNAVISLTFWGLSFAIIGVVDLGDIAAYIIYAVGNAAFVVFDIGFTKLIAYYSSRLKGHIK